ncbi:hypothetical protein SAMN02927937_00526 [Paenimyroides aquimaris]|uniref:Uncharacterized protein n=1 Tax=Paenimyroides marinum TaxID=1159016 RepID=A0A1H6JS49_9FLAO|nr:hypothetical protein SAMN02927937_00526 [Paenimyroides aquimaris]
MPMNNFKKAGKACEKPLPASIKINVFKTIEKIEKENKNDYKKKKDK